MLYECESAVETAKVLVTIQKARKLHEVRWRHVMTEKVPETDRPAGPRSAQRLNVEHGEGECGQSSGCMQTLHGCAVWTGRKMVGHFKHFQRAAWCVKALQRPLRPSRVSPPRETDPNNGRHSGSFTRGCTFIRCVCKGMSDLKKHSLSCTLSQPVFVCMCVFYVKTQQSQTLTSIRLNYLINALLFITGFDTFITDYF